MDVKTGSLEVLINGGAASTLTVMIRKFVAGVSLTFVSVSFSFAAPASKPNLIVITLSSTRADRMGFLGAKSALTPNLDRLAGESIVFDHAYAQAPGSLVSHATILSGAYPMSTGMSEIGGALSPSLPYLPDLLKAQAYRTAAFVGSADLDPWSGLAQGFDRGFQTYDVGVRQVSVGTGASPVQAKRSSTADRGQRSSPTQRRPDQVVTSAALWLTRNTQAPFFLWIQIDPHSAAASYDAGIAAADTAIGKLLAILHQQKLDDTTAVVVAASQGESLGAHGEETHGIFLYDETIHVPLIVRLPEPHPAAKRVLARATGKVRLIDIAPTLLEIAAVPVPSQMQGQSLLRIAKSTSSGSAGDQPVYSRSDLPQRGFGWSPLESWRAGKYLYIRAPKPELYDSTADPGAAHNLAQSSKATLDTMAAQLDSFDRNFDRNYERHLSGEAGKSSAELSSSEMQKLASLGYIGLQKSSGAAAAVTGTDPKDKIAIANKVIGASSRDQSKPDVAIARAIAALEPIVAADPNLYLAQYTLGTALARKAQYAEAAKHLHKAIELQPDSAWAHYEIGAALVKAGDFKTAIVHLEIATGHLPAFAPAHLALAEAYEHMGRTEDAKRERSKGGQK
jgi:arylsulfatase A-like enzyme/Flp pilus assembly protein TadD